MTDDIFVLGDKRTVFGFALVGVEGAIVSTKNSFDRTLDEQLGRADLQLLLITQQAAAFDRKRVDELKAASNLSPLIVELPGPEEERQGRTLRELVHAAIGIDVSSSKGEG